MKRALATLVGPLLAAGGAPRVGDRFPALELPASDGGTFRFADARGRWPLLLFYRGDS
jgi:peroxiredoxin